MRVHLLVYNENAFFSIQGEWKFVNRYSGKKSGKEKKERKQEKG